MSNEEKNELVPEGLNEEQLMDYFQNLASEVLGGEITVPSLLEKEQKKDPPVFRGYNPTVMDFLARANTRQECEEIIAYCLEKGDIDTDTAIALRETLDKSGPEAFGHRTPGYYDRTGVDC